jgi:hypothetical protein
MNFSNRRHTHSRLRESETFRPRADGYMAAEPLTRHVVRLGHTDHAAGVAAVDAKEHWDARDVDLFVAAVRDLIGFIID